MGDMSFLEEKRELDESGLKTLRAKVDALLSLREKIEEVEESLKELKKDELEISRVTLPGFLKKYGVEKLTIDSQYDITIKEDISCAVPKTPGPKREAVLKWIVGTGGGGIIKDTLTVPDPTLAVIEELEKEGAAYKREASVNAATFKAYVRGLLGFKKGVEAQLDITDIPAEVNLYPYSETVIKIKR